ncbi:MAG: low molecular weight protein-tyrosine-phosphatase [Pirellulales bacterium]
MSKAISSKSILFVCLGNICRSPAAEGVMQHLINQRSLSEQIRVDSAGTAGYHIGKLADARMRAAAERRGLNLTSRSRLVLPSDLRDFDLVVPMDRSNYRDLMGLVPGAKHDNVKMLSDFLDSSWPREVPDPYYGGEEGFEYVLDMLQAACPAILNEIVGSQEPSA